MDHTTSSNESSLERDCSVGLDADHGTARVTADRLASREPIGTHIPSYGIGNRPIQSEQFS